MTENKQATWIFIIGFFSLVLLVIIGLFFMELMRPSVTTTNEEEANAQVQTPTVSADPLVSMTPDPTEQATPRMIASDPVRGATKPTVTIMEFGDFQCDDCAAMSAIVAEVLKAYPDDVRHVWKDFPIVAEHQQAEQAAYAARCAQQQEKFWEYHDYLLTNQTSFPLLPWSDIANSVGLDETAFNTCMESGDQEYLVLQSFTVGKTLGLTQAPSYYINDQFISGPVSAEEMKKIVEAEIKKSGKEPANEE